MWPIARLCPGARRQVIYIYKAADITSLRAAPILPKDPCNPDTLEDHFVGFPYFRS